MELAEVTGGILGLKFSGNLLCNAQSRSLGRNTKDPHIPQVPTSHTNKWNFFFKKLNKIKVFIYVYTGETFYKIGYKTTTYTFKAIIKN